MINFCIKNIFLSCLILNSCQKQPEYIQLVDKLIGDCSSSLNDKYGLRLTGSGGRWMYDVEQISSYYQTNTPMSIDQARDIYLEIVQCYLCKVNGDKSLQPFLHVEPFTYKNLRIMLSVDLSLQNQDNSQKDKVFLVFKSKEEEIIYETYDWEKEDYEVILEETYQEARAKVNAR